MSSEEAGAVPCAANPDVLTSLRCGRCDTPICPRCLVMTPVGARCRACARLRAHPVYDVRPLHYLRGAGAGLAVALIGGLVAASVPFLGFLGLLLLGWLTGEAVTAAANRKRGTGLAAVAAAATVLGALGGPALLVAAELPPGVPLDVRLAAGWSVALARLLSLWGLFLVLAAVVAAGRVR
jgi:hypothetical protein